MVNSIEAEEDTRYCQRNVGHAAHQIVEALGLVEVSGYERYPLQKECGGDAHRKYVRHDWQ